MKNIITIAALVLCILSCSNSRAISSTNNQQQMTTQLPDSVLQYLYNNNELVIGVAFENFAWGHNATYRVFAMNKKEEWMAYTWYANYRAVGEKPAVNQSMVNADTCKAILGFLQQSRAEQIKGDAGDAGCADKKKDCVINDGSTWHLFWLTKDRIVAPSYYEPQFFEDCCPGDKGRKLFLDAVNRIDAVLDKNEPVK